jgi:hypothetical protein
MQTEYALLQHSWLNCIVKQVLLVGLVNTAQGRDGRNELRRVLAYRQGK